MRQLVKVWVLVTAMVMGGALPPQVMGDSTVALQWCAQAKSKKKNKKKKKHKRKADDPVKAASTLVSVPAIGTPAVSVAPQSASNALMAVSIPKGVSNQVINYQSIRVNFNPALRIPNCVAYELTATMIDMADAPGHENRKNYNYSRDHNVASCPENWEYRGSGYSRGHMAPAMDMRWDKTAMAQCFYMTNMCPQDHDLNGGAWRLLEEKIHRWGKRDKRLIIATGPIMGKSAKTTGKSCAVAIPDAFYKVVYAPEQGRAIGFIYPNEPVSGSFKKRAVTIDEVERLTGLDFFPALPDNVENALESHANPDQWSN